MRLLVLVRERQNRPTTYSIGIVRVLPLLDLGRLLLLRDRRAAQASGNNIRRGARII